MTAFARLSVRAVLNTVFLTLAVIVSGARRMVSEPFVIRTS